ncbi:MAG TPA: hypothetical protein VFX55_21965 [Duganella sp.]|nr:hypothetical protein [Duganella sp.]
MRTKFLAAFIFGCCALSVTHASELQILATDLQDFQGQYDLADGCSLTVKHRGRQLVMQVGNQTETKLMAIGSAAFVSKSGQVRLEFMQYPNGNVPAVRVTDMSGRSVCQTKDQSRQ